MHGPSKRGLPPTKRPRLRLASPGSFLMAGCAAGSFSGWLGCAFCRESPSSPRMRPIEVTCRLLANRFLQIGRKAARLRSRLLEHDAIEFPLLLGVELRRAPVAREVGEPIQAVLVVRMASRAAFGGPCLPPAPPPGSCHRAGWQSPECAVQCAHRSRPWRACAAPSGVRSRRIESADILPSIESLAAGNHESRADGIPQRPLESGVSTGGMFPTAGRRTEAVEVHGRAKGVIIRQGEEGTPVAYLCRQAGISQATHFNWKRRSPA